MCDEDENEDEGMWRHEYAKWGGYVCAEVTCEGRTIGFHFEKKSGEAFFIVAGGCTFDECRAYEKSLLKRRLDFEIAKHRLVFGMNRNTRASR